MDTLPKRAHWLWLFVFIQDDLTKLAFAVPSFIVDVVILHSILERKWTGKCYWSPQSQWYPNLKIKLLIRQTWHPKLGFPLSAQAAWMKVMRLKRCFIFNSSCTFSLYIYVCLPSVLQNCNLFNSQTNEANAGLSLKVSMWGTRRYLMLWLLWRPINPWYHYLTQEKKWHLWHCCAA